MARKPAPKPTPKPAAPAAGAATTTRMLVLYDPDTGEVAGTHTVEWLEGAAAPPEHATRDLAEAAAVLEIDAARRPRLRLLRAAPPGERGAALRVDGKGAAARLVATRLARKPR
jgi:hypothetical protein